MAPKSVPLLSTNIVAQKDKEIQELERKLNFFRRENDKHLKNEFELENRIKSLTARLGFRSLSEAETQLGERDISLFELERDLETRAGEVQHLTEDLLVREKEVGGLRKELGGMRERVGELEREVREVGWSGQEEVGMVEREVAELRLDVCEKDALIARLQAPKVPLGGGGGKENSQSQPHSQGSQVPPSSPLHAPHLSTPTKSSNTALHLQALLSDLQERYDSLLRVYRENVGQRQKEHRMWREYKEDWEAKYERKRKREERGRGTPGKRRKVGMPTPATGTRQGVTGVPSSPTARLSQSLAPPSSDVPPTPSQHSPPPPASQTQLEDNEIEVPPPRLAQGGGAQERSRVLVPASSDGPEQVASSPAELAQSRKPVVPTGTVFPPPLPPLLHASSSVRSAPPPQPFPDPPLPRQWVGGRAPPNPSFLPPHLHDPDPHTTPRPSTSKDKGKSKEKEKEATPVVPADRDERLRYLKRLNDLPHREYVEGYSAYKGRGRYARDGAGEEGVNARYEIDRSRNEGVGYRYDEVVRGREQRRRLHGGDCECCREYYQAVGPLPPRLEAPLWKSPSPEPSRSRSPRRTAHDREREREIDAHRQEVSRHRQAWVGGRTPPDYWHIGFPDTQQVEDINRRAREMHREKEREIEREARKKDGRYKRRD